MSKANVCPYWGREIPGAQALGLDADKIYRLLRDPAELEKAAQSFSNKPLLIKHVAISAVAPNKDMWVGTTGEVTWEAPYLVSRPIMVWTKEAIDLITSGAQRELSSGYRYRAVMEPGVYLGEAYDGRMVDIDAQHVAIVSEGRVGPDVFVKDEIPPEFQGMRNKVAAAVAKIVAPFLAADSDKTKLALALDAFDEKMDKDDEDAKDAAANYYGCDAEEWGKKDAKDRKAARDAWEDDEDKKEKAKDKKAKDAKAAKDKAAKDAADPDDKDDKAKDSKPSGITQDQLDTAIRAAADLARKESNALHAAREAVKPIVGIVAMDSADEVYAYALKHAGVKTDGVHPSAFPALVDVIKTRKAAPTPIAFDAAAGEHSIASIFGLN